jgi:AraC-like DNA-binding protein
MLGSSILTFTDLDTYQKSARLGNARVISAEEGNFEAKITRIDLSRLWMEQNSVSLALIAHIKLRRERNRIIFLAGADQAPMFHSGIQVIPGDIVFEASGEHHRRVPANCCWDTLSLTPEDLATYGRALTGRDIMAPSATRVVRPKPALMSRLLNLHHAANDLAATAPDMIARREIAKTIEQELVRAMVGCLADTGDVEKHAYSSRGLAVMRRFEQILEASADQPLYITEICVQIGVTDRSLRAYCQEHLGMSPHRYLWLRRMNLARRALARADARTRTVTEIAGDCGFGELGRFAVSYRKLFGESPSVTLRHPPNDPRPSRIGPGEGMLPVRHWQRLAASVSDSA